MIKQMAIALVGVLPSSNGIAQTASPSLPSGTECPAPAGTQVFTQMKNLPPPIAIDFARHVSWISDANGPFNPIDVIRDATPMFRLITAWHKGQRWEIAYEHGGQAYTTHVVVYDLSTPNKNARLLANIDDRFWCAELRRWNSNDPDFKTMIDRHW